MSKAISNADLSGVSLAGLDISGADLSGAVLTRVYGQLANVSDATLPTGYFFKNKYKIRAQGYKTHEIVELLGLVGKRCEIQHLDGCCFLSLIDDKNISRLVRWWDFTYLKETLATISNQYFLNYFFSQIAYSKFN